MKSLAGYATKPRPGKTVFEWLSILAKEVDGAIFIFSEDDKVWYRNDSSTQPRDNVLIEYGIFLGALGVSKVIFCRHGKPRTATDLNGVMYVDISPTNYSSAKIKIRKWLQRLEADAKLLETKTVEKLNSPFQALGKQTLFEKGTELIRKSKYRIALVARTPVPLVGTRPYDNSGNAIFYEIEQFEAYLSIARTAGMENHPSFRCVANLSSLKAEIRSVNVPNFTQRVNKNLTNFYEISNASQGGKCQIRWHKNETPMTYLVADDNFLIWFKDSSGENVWITAQSQPIANALYFMSERDSDTIVLEDLNLT